MMKLDIKKSVARYAWRIEQLEQRHRYLSQQFANERSGREREKISRKLQEIENTLAKL